MLLTLPVVLLLLTPGAALASEPTITEIVGSDRYDTAILVSQKAYPGGAATVFLVKGDNFPDALAAAPLAAAYDGPVILTPTSGLTDAVRYELTRLGPTKVFFIGLPVAVRNQVSALLPGIPIVSVVGTDRYHTAAMLADELNTKNGGVPQVVLASGDKFPDALSVAPLAAAKGWAILLTPQAGPLPVVTSQKIQALGVTKALVVGTYVKPLPPSQVVSIVGTDRYNTCARICDYAVSQGLSLELTAVATGENYPDALVVGPYLAKSMGILLLSRSAELPQDIVDRLDAAAGSIKNIEAVGVSDEVIWNLTRVCQHVMTYYYCFNVNKPPFDNVKVRQALALAVDRTKIISVVTDPARLLPATSFAPPAMPGFDFYRQDYLKPTAQVALAKSLLVAAGYPGGIGLPEIEIAFNTSPSHQAIAQKVAQQWNAIGVKTRLRSIDWQEYMDLLNSDPGQFMVYRMGWVADYYDAVNFFDLFGSGSEFNWTGWSDAAYDQGLKDALGPMTDAERWVLYTGLEKKLTVDEMPVIPLYWF